jgi:hypothetical protein
MTDCLIENIGYVECIKYVELHAEYQSKIENHLSDCFCELCLIRNACAAMIIKNRGKYKNV